MLKLKNIIDTVRVKYREKMNIVFGRYRRKKLVDSNVTIISNNCWGGHVYRYFGIKYLSPTIGLYFFSEDYIKLCKNIRYYMNQELKFVEINQCKYANILRERNASCPIGMLDDIYIIFHHYKTKEEAYKKWHRRKKRINYNNLVFKFSEQNNCSEKDILEFDKLNYDKKVVFTVKDYQINSQIIWGEKCENGIIPNDTINIRKYINLINFINTGSFK